MAAATFIIDSERKRDQLVKRLQAMRVVDGVVWQMTVQPYQPKRSEDANRRLWALHKVAAEHTGHSTEEMHNAMCWKFLPRRTVHLFGEDVEMCGHSSKLTVKEFRDFMDQVESFYIAELGVMLGEYA
jgi:hypothetical protein